MKSLETFNIKTVHNITKHLYALSLSLERLSKERNSKIVKEIVRKVELSELSFPLCVH